MELLAKLQAGDRFALAQAITLVESKRLDHRELSADLIEACLPYTGKSIRIGITGVPGAGKSTFIDGFGLYLIELGHRVAILTIDPSSSRTKGSILGDKTRMENLAQDPNAFIRPSPSGNSTGGVSQGTREAVYLCEAAGFDVIIVETVGVGQNETAIRGMVDFFLLIMLAGAGDELQGIKRGIIEMADMLVINKADINPEQIDMTIHNYLQALHLFTLQVSDWPVPVLKASAIEKTGFDSAWGKICDYLNVTRSNGFFEANRREQNQIWFREALLQQLESEFYAQPKIQSKLDEMEKLIAEQKVSPRKAVSLLTQQKETR